MMRYDVRALGSSDFAALQQLESDVFGEAGEAVLCLHFLWCVRSSSPIPARADAYLLCFVRGREAYCTTMAVIPEFQRTRVTPLLLSTLVQTIIEHVDVCWFTVKPDNGPARALHRMLGASESGEVRFVSRIDRATFDAQRPKYERLGLLPARPVREAA
jgi:ribosomal protein S18 acetylase RimI-like enzyme